MKDSPGTILLARNSTKELVSQHWLVMMFQEPFIQSQIASHGAKNFVKFVPTGAKHRLALFGFDDGMMMARTVCSRHHDAVH